MAQGESLRSIDYAAVCERSNQRDNRLSIGLSEGSVANQMHNFVELLLRHPSLS
jgi:hypothetical protein